MHSSKRASCSFYITEIKLSDGNYKNAETVFEDVHALGEEITKRWNEYKANKTNKQD